MSSVNPPIPATCTALSFPPCMSLGYESSLDLQWFSPKRSPTKLLGLSNFRLHGDILTRNCSSLALDFVCSVSHPRCHNNNFVFPCRRFCEGLLLRLIVKQIFITLYYKLIHLNWYADLALPHSFLFNSSLVNVLIIFRNDQILEEVHSESETHIIELVWLSESHCFWLVNFLNQRVRMLMLIFLWYRNLLVVQLCSYLPWIHRWRWSFCLLHASSTHWGNLP